MRMKSVYRLAGLLAASCSLLLASVVNGGFETGDLTSWSVQGSAEVSTGVDYPPTVNPDAGSFAARIISGSIPAGDLETFLGLGAGALTSIAGGGQPTVGSAILQEGVEVLAGEQLTFRWNFATPEGEETTYNDFSFFGFSLLGQPAQVFLLSNANSLPPLGPDDSLRISGWQSGSYSFTQSGTYTIFFGSFDLEDGALQSELWVDNVGLSDGSPIPEPSALLLTGLGLVGLLAARKRLQTASK